jgi:hypothetical protein
LATPNVAAVKQSVTGYMLDYYSSLRPHKHADELALNVAEKSYSNAQKSVAKNTSPLQWRFGLCFMYLRNVKGYS